MITLDENHIYHDAETGAVIPGVTSILRDAGLIDTAWFDDYSRDRGTLIHQACALFDYNNLDESSLDPAIEPYVRAWMNFRKDTGFFPVDIEQIVFNPHYRYAGKYDVYGLLGKDGYLIDRKSGASQPWSQLQTAAYAECIPGVNKRAVIELDDAGKYRLIEHKDRNDIKVFLAALAVVTWKRNNLK